MALSINHARLARPGVTVDNPDVKITIMFYIAGIQSQPTETYKNKPEYFNCHTVANVQVFKTNKITQKENDIKYSRNEFVFVIYKTADLTGIDRNINTGGDVLKIDDEPKLWYPVSEIIQNNKKYCVVKCYRTNQDPELGSTLRGQELDYKNLLGI